MKIMRCLTIIIITIVLAMGTSLAFDWEGELDPNEFDKWKVLFAQPTPQGLVWVLIKNPDEESLIDIVAMAVDPSSSVLLGYRYFKYGEPHSFVFNPDLNKYVKKRLTEEQRNKCLKCHESGKTPGISI